VTWCRASAGGEAAVALALLASAAAAAAELLALEPSRCRHRHRQTATSASSIRQVQLAADGYVWTAVNSRPHARLFLLPLCAAEAVVPAAAADWPYYGRMTSF